PFRGFVGGQGGGDHQGPQPDLVALGGPGTPHGLSPFSGLTYAVTVTPRVRGGSSGSSPRFAEAGVTRRSEIARKRGKSSRPRTNCMTAEKLPLISNSIGNRSYDAGLGCPGLGAPLTAGRPPGRAGAATGPVAACSGPGLSEVTVTPARLLNSSSWSSNRGISRA